MFDWFHGADLWLFHKINAEWTGPALDHLLPTVTNFAAWAPVFVLLGACALAFGGPQWRLFCLAIVVATVLGDSLVSGTLKRQTNRRRPRNDVADVIVRDLPDWHPQLLAVFQAPVISHEVIAKPGQRGGSFPSSHTVNMCSLATVCWLVFGRRSAWVAVLAFLVAWSRIYCGAHWPSDVVAGIPIGMICGIAAVDLTDWLWRRWGARFFPAAQARVPSLKRAKSGPGKA